MSVECDNFLKFLTNSLSFQATTLLLFLIAISTAVAAEGQQGHSNGYNYPKPTPPPAFNGYDYPKPSKPFHEGYTYNTPKCPLVLPSTSTVTDYKTIVSSTFLTQTQTLPPITSTSFTTSFVTLPPEVVTQTDTSTLYITFTSTEVSVSTTIEIQPTTVTSLLTTTYCQPNTYLPPPTPPPNTYLPVNPPSKEYLPQRPPVPQTNVASTSNVVRQSESSGNQGGFISTFVQQQSGPIKRATAGSPSRLEPLSSERIEANEVIPGEDSSQPAINIIYIDRHGVSEGKPPAGLMNWLLCKFNLSNGSCSDN
ncbi:uncharacterized protein LOC126560820 [Anopheles maculipalpis]|uniref:uncharacterized protein LOC126560820 n=1 Tax=Anopheles maculipalpis TaxID=1496333 RepID=UPI002158D653|nr:uncharacterized protein LOC126560820 [Anopheles maculipalpis]